MIAATLLCAALNAGAVADLRALPPEQVLDRLSSDTSESGAFLRTEALLRAGRVSEAAAASAAFQASRPGSVLQARARLLDAWMLLLRGEHAKGCQILSEVASGTDLGAAVQARQGLRQWIRSGLVPASQLLRLPSEWPDPDDSTLKAVGAAVPARPLVVLLPQSGPYAQIGRRMSRGAQLAASGTGANVVVLDEPVDPIQAALLVRGMLRVVRPVAVVGPLLSNTATTVALEMARSAPEIPLVLPAATSPAVASLDPGAWQINITTRQQGTSAAQVARNCLRASEAFLLWPKGDFGEAVTDGFRQEFLRRGGRIAWQREYTGGNDFRPQLEALRRTALDLARQRGEDTANLQPVVFVPSENPSEALALAAQAAQLGMKPRWIGASGWHARSFLLETQGRMEGIHLVTDNVPDENRGSWKLFAQKWKGSEGDAPDRLAALGWDAVHLALSEKIPSEFSGAQAEIRLDPRLRSNTAAGILRVEKGAFVPAACPSP